jgi:hypothetical protein
MGRLTTLFPVLAMMDAWSNRICLYAENVVCLGAGSGNARRPKPSAPQLNKIRWQCWNTVDVHQVISLPCLVWSGWVTK